MKWFNVIFYLTLGALGAVMPYFSNDEAVKYIDPSTRWWLILACGTLQGGFSSVKAYLSIPQPGNGKPPVQAPPTT